MSHAQASLCPPANTPNMYTCGICFNLMQDPVTLECGDSFCMSCLRHHMERHSAVEGVVCFLCHKLSRNVRSNNLVQYCNQERSMKIRELGSGINDSLRCNWCEEAAATYYCAACTYSLCGECNVAVHKNSAKRSHTVQSIAEGRRPTQMYRKCSQKSHEEFRAEFFCIKCQVAVCVYCLQTGVHRGHDNIPVTDAAADVRQQLMRQVEEVQHVKARLDGVVQELNRVTTFYEESYDHVEQSITDRFATYQQQLLKKEAEVRELLQSLRINGDQTISECRRETLRNMNSVNEAIARGKRLQSNASDAEVLENRIVLNTFQRMEMPIVAGTGFRFTDPGDLNLAGIGISLDIGVKTPNMTAVSGAGPNNQPAAMMTMPHTGQSYNATRGGAASVVTSSVGGPIPAPNASVRRRKQQITFPEDAEVEVREVQDGTLFRCVETTMSRQVGIRANETFIDGVNTWKVRLDRVFEGGVGIMCVGGTQEVAPGEGFFWKPGRQAYEGRLGIPTDLVAKHPVTRAGDTLRITFDADKRQLRVAHNGIERGVLLTGVQGHVTPCFVFSAGECVTLLQ